MKPVIAICAILTAGACICGCISRPGLTVSHTPNPCAVHDVKLPGGAPFPYMWFYRTEVRNNTDHPIQVTQFEGCFYKNSQWVPANILNRKLTAEDFTLWYTNGAPVTNGWIQPQASAVCDPNWHGVTSPVAPRCKWTYDGVDAKGNTYHAEAKIDSVPIQKR